MSSSASRCVLARARLRAQFAGIPPGGAKRASSSIHVAIIASSASASAHAAYWPSFRQKRSKPPSAR
ncbi:hypothetical protein PTBPS01_05785 [Burkholderia pseudomallei]|nr:hypothetical protein PTBPS01_05785 [Burkholderia pseudomallei]